MIADQDEVRAALSDFELRIQSVLDLAWDEWLEMPKKGVFSARSRASLIFDLIRLHALDQFDGDPDIHVIVQGQTVKFLFKDRVLVRFKKANPRGIGSNIETQAVLEFVDPQLRLPSFLPDIFKVEICYHLDRLATKMERVAVTARERKKMVWSYDIAGRSEPSVFELPGPTSPDVPPAEVRPRIRDDKQKLDTQ